MARLVLVATATSTTNTGDGCSTFTGGIGDSNGTSQVLLLVDAVSGETASWCCSVPTHKVVVQDQHGVKNINKRF